MGIYFDKRHKKWGARLRTGGKSLWFGTFQSKKEAQRAYDLGSAPFKNRLRAWHGFASSKDPKERRFYSIWTNLHARCSHPKASSYVYYGGRGIKCLWVSFPQFHADMYTSYLAHVQVHGLRRTSIDRIDNDGNYEKANCRWATPYGQNQNRGTPFNPSGYAGVSFNRRDNLWMARLERNGKQVLNKCFKSKREAIKARKAALKKYETD